MEKEWTIYQDGSGGSWDIYLPDEKIVMKIPIRALCELFCNLIDAKIKQKTDEGAYIIECQPRDTTAELLVTPYKVQTKNKVNN